MTSNKEASAFPGLETFPNKKTMMVEYTLTGGLTKREYFAAAALSGIAARCNFFNPSCASDGVKEAIVAAESLLQELSK